MLPQQSVSVAVCVATFRRPHELAALLESLDQCRRPTGFTLRVVVVDNDAHGSAEEVVRVNAAKASSAVEYVVEEERSIAAARNRALALLSPDDRWLIFVDDDERVHADWLLELLNCAEQFSADVVAGPVIPELPDHAPVWAIRGGWFERRRLPTGARIKWAATNNVLVRRSALDLMSVPRFDAEFGLSGGSDLEFFDRLRRCGARMVWCDDALVFEGVPDVRLKKGWVAKRSLRLGNVTGRLLVARRGRVYALAYAVHVLLRAVPALASSLTRRSPWGRAALQPGPVAVGILLAAAGIRVSEYHGPFLQRAGRVASCP